MPPIVSISQMGQKGSKRDLTISSENCHSLVYGMKFFL